jgi:hypothetical protein
LATILFDEYRHRGFEDDQQDTVTRKAVEKYSTPDEVVSNARQSWFSLFGKDIEKM